MRFAFIDRYRGALSRAHLCGMLGVTDRGLRAWRRRPPSRRQRTDRVLLAHIRDQHRSSLGSYGRPRMTEELKEPGFEVGHRRIGRPPPGRFALQIACGAMDAPERHPDRADTEIQGDDR